MGVAGLKLVIFTLLLLATSSFCASSQRRSSRRQGRTSPAYDVYYGWKKVDYNFKSEEERALALENGKFIPENVIITGVKVHDQRMFLTTPRFKPGVPATVSWVPYDGTGGGGSPPLNPYPSWEMQKQGDCSALQLVQAMEIDTFGRLWAVDTGRLYALSNKSEDVCPPKIVLIDLNSESVIHTHVFDNQVVSWHEGFPKDITVACQDKNSCTAYIVDLTENRIVVYDLERDKASFVYHETMAPNPAKSDITIKGISYNIPYGISGMGLAPKSKNFDTLYYSCIADVKIFSVKTKDLRAASSGSRLNDSVVKLQLPVKPFHSDGMTMDETGTLYFGALEQNALYKWDMNYGLFANANRTRFWRRRKAPSMIAKDDKDVVWQDTYGFDNTRRHMFLVTDNFQLFDDTAYDFNEINFRVLRFKLGRRSYLY